MKTLFLVPLLFISCLANGQEKIANRNFFKKFLQKSDDKSLLIIGENHASAVGSTIYPGIIKYLNKKTGLTTLLIEFGPSEAYFYTKYLKTGNEKHLNYTIYAGSYKGWREAWRKIYEYNKALKKPLQIIGVDFDRARTFAYALFSIFMNYDERPAFIEELLNEIKTDEFYNTYTIGYPTKKDKEWSAKTKTLLKNNFSELKLFLTPNHLKIIDAMIKNEGIGYGGKREEALAANTKRIIKNTDEEDFLLLIGRSHAYIHPIYGKKDKLATMLVNDSTINILTGTILFENSVLWGGKNSKEPITLFEIKNKIPWKRYASIINKKTNRELKVIPLKKDLCPLAYYTDYILVARNQEAYEILK